MNRMAELMNEDVFAIVLRSSYPMLFSFIPVLYFPSIPRARSFQYSSVVIAAIRS